MPEPIGLDNNPLSIASTIEAGDAPTYSPSEKDKEVISTVFLKFRAAQTNRDRSFKFFDNRNLVEYIEDSVGRFMTNLDEREGIEDWQARVNVPMTHNKVTAVLAKIVSQLPIAEISPRLDNGNKKADILNVLYKYSEDIDDYEELMICAALEALLKGTVIGYEGHALSSRAQRIITGYDKDNVPTIKENVKNTCKLYGAIVPLEEFYPASVSIRRMSDMPYAFRRYEVSFSEFLDNFGTFKNYQYVNPKVTASGETTTQTPFYHDYVSIDVEDGNVEVIEYFNKQTDEYVILANGVWLNPMGGSVVAPNPFGHKKLPFWSARFDTNASDFFYGKSLADRLSSMQDVLNVLTNMLLDQSFLTIFPPVLTAGIDPLEEDYLRPGRRVPVDTQGLPLNQAFMKLDLGTPSGWHQFILQYTQNIMEQSSVDQVASGVAGVGGRTTAEEIRTAAAGVTAIIGIFGKLLNNGIKHKALLRAANILQFYTDPRYPIADRVLGPEGDMFNKAFNVVSLDSQPLSNGRRGKKIVAMFPTSAELPTANQIRTREKMYQLETGSPIEIKAVTPEYLQDIEYDVKIVMGENTPETKDMKKALALEKARVYGTMFPDLVNKQELANSVAEAMGDNPEKIFNQQAPAAPAGLPGQAPDAGATGGLQNPSMMPQGDVSGNMLRGMMGGEAGTPQLNSLAQ